MEITTLSNLMSLASDVSGHSFDAQDAKLSEDTFTQVVEDVFDKIDMLHKWNRDQTELSSETEAPQGSEAGPEGELVIGEQDMLVQGADGGLHGVPVVRQHGAGQLGEQDSPPQEEGLGETDHLDGVMVLKTQ